MAVADFDPIIREASAAWNVDPNLIRAVMHQESGGNRIKNGRPITSPAGAGGLMQIMPETARDLGVEDVHDPVQAIWGGTKYLSQLLDQFKDPNTAVAAYNAGPGKTQAVLEGQAQFKPETVAYIPAVGAHYAKFSRQAPGDMQAKSAKTPETGGESVDDWVTKRFAPPTAAPQPAEANVDDWVTKRFGGPAQTSAPTPAPTDSTSTTDTAVANEIAPPAETNDPTAAVRAIIATTDPGQAGTALRTAMANGAALAGNKLAAVPGAVGSAVSAIGNAAARGFGSEPLGPNPKLMGAVTNGLQSTGILAPEGATGNPIQSLNADILTALAAATIPFEAALRAGGAIMRGGQEAVMQAGTALGAPQLARAIAAIPEGLPFGTMGMGAPGAVGAGARRAGNRLMGKPPGGVVAGATPPPEPPPMPPGVNPVATPEAQAAVARMKPPAPGTAEPIPGAAAPRPVGAAASAAGDANMTPRETQAYRAVSETQKLVEPQPVGRDPTIYVQGVEPTAAHIEQSANVSREAKMVESAMPEEWKTVAKEHNEARQQHFARLAGSPVDVENAVAAREAMAQGLVGPNGSVWRQKSPADVSPVMQTAADIIASPDGKRPAVRKVVNSIVAELTGQDGAPVTDPELLYGVRKHIGDLLSNEGRQENPLAQRAKSNLLQLQEALDAAIEPAAPGFREYLARFADASRPIDAMRVLQEFEPKIVDTQARVQLSRVQNMLRQIVEARNSPDPTNRFKAIPDETMAQLWALRDDLRRVASAEELARAKGSDSMQNGLDMVKSMAGGGARMAVGALAHAAMPIAGPLVVNPIINRLSAHFGGAKMARRSNELLRPDKSQYRPLNPPE